MEPPQVIVPLENIQLNEGSPVLLQSTIVGKPRPDVNINYSDDCITVLINIVLYSDSIVCLAQRWETIDCIKSSSYTLRYRNKTSAITNNRRTTT